MHSKVKRTLAGAAAAAAAMTALPLLAISPAGAVAVNSGTLSVSPLGGTSSDNFTINIASGPAACPGDTATDGYDVQGFMVPAGTDYNTLSFNAIGPSVGRSLVDPGGTPLAYDTTEPVSGNLWHIPATLSFANNSPGDFAPGAWDMGIACTQGSGAGMVKTYWTVPVTITTNTTTGGPAQISWAYGAVPGLPTGLAATPGNTTANVSWTAPTGADPAVTGYKVYVDGALTQTLGNVTSTTLASLTNGTTYQVAVEAVNSVGGSGQTAAVSVIPNIPPAPPVTGLAAQGNPGNVTASWSAYTGTPSGATFSGYSVAVTKGVGTAAVALPSSPFTTTSTSFVVDSTVDPAITAGDTYNFVVTPLFSAPAGQLGTPSFIASGTVIANQTLKQVITVTRPVGALVLTQVCGRYGTLDGEAAQLGFPTGIPAATPVNDGDSADPLAGQAPYLTQGAVPFSAVGTTAGPGSTPVAAGAQDVPAINGYPYPVNPTTGEASPTYPTWCGVELGAAKFVATGDPAYGKGAFFAASGRLNQVTVVDTRDGDVGFNVAASVSDFTAAGNKSFSGNQLGWTPRVNRDTAQFVDALGNTYDQTTAAGSPVAQNTQVSSGNGLHTFNANTLIKANAKATVGTASTGGLGIAVADARLKLAIPVTAIAGNYTAVLTISSF